MFQKLGVKMKKPFPSIEWKSVLIFSLKWVLPSISSLIIVFVFLRDQVWNPSINWLSTSLTQPPQVLLRIHLLVTLCFLFLACYVVYKIYKYVYWRKKRRFFFEYGFYWCYNRSKNDVEEIPYCKNHRIQLTEMKFGFICFECQGGKRHKRKAKVLELADRNNIYFMIKPKILAKVEGFYKKF